MKRGRDHGGAAGGDDVIDLSVDDESQQQSPAPSSPFASSSSSPGSGAAPMVVSQTHAQAANTILATLKQVLNRPVLDEAAMVREVHKALELMQEVGPGKVVAARRASSAKFAVLEAASGAAASAAAAAPAQPHGLENLVGAMPLRTFDSYKGGSILGMLGGRPLSVIDDFTVAGCLNLLGSVYYDAQAFSLASDMFIQSYDAYLCLDTAEKKKRLAKAKAAADKKIIGKAEDAAKRAAKKQRRKRRSSKRAARIAGVPAGTAVRGDDDDDGDDDDEDDDEEPEEEPEEEALEKDDEKHCGDDSGDNAHDKRTRFVNVSRNIALSFHSQRMYDEAQRWLEHALKKATNKD